MKGIQKGTALILSAVFLLSGCNRRDSSKNGDGTRIQPGAPGEESEQSGYLAMQIKKVYESQKPLDQSPWHVDGGEWTFLDCQLARDPSIKILIGARTRSTDKSDIPVSWGEARLAMSDPAAGGRFVDAFAEAFHVQSPPSHGNKPNGFITMSTAVLGSNLARDSAGGFKDGHRGSWTATKWFLQDEEAEGEVFFNYSISEKRAEFSEKDPDYREDLVQELVVGLRDGPLPERTPENDTNLTLVGPTVTNWIRLADTNETCQFSPQGDLIAITGSERGAHSKIFTAQTARPAQRKLWGEFEGYATVQEFLPLDHGLSLFVVEILHNNPKVFSSSDPQRLWLVDGQGKHQVTIPPGLTNWFVLKNCVSPDGQFVALHSWQAQSNKKRSRVIHLGNLQSGQWTIVQVPDTALELVGWTGKGSKGIVLTGMDFDKKSIRKPYSLEAATGQLVPLESMPAGIDPDHRHSPDGKRSIEVIGTERLVISDLGTGQKREFIFNPYDRRNVFPGSLHWVNDRYLAFEGSRMALINTETLKMNFVANKGSEINVAEFSPDFKFALGTEKDDTHYLGTVQTPE